MKKFFILSGCSLALAFLAISTAAARSPKTDITISPAITEWIIKPGEKQTKKIRIFNNTDKPLPIETMTSSLIGPQVPAQKSSIFNVSSWVSIKESDFILREGRNKEVEVTVAVPKRATPGGHYATLYFHQLSPSNGSSASPVASRVGSLLFIVVEGKIVKQLEHDAFTIHRSGRDITMKLRLRNAGNTHVLPQGYVAMLDWKGNEVDRVPLGAGMVLPYTSRDFELKWRAPSWGFYGVKPVIFYGANAIAIPSRTIVVLPLLEISFLLIMVSAGWLCVYRVRGRWVRAVKNLISTK